MPADPHGAALIVDAAFRTGVGLQRMVRQERREVRAHADRPDARTAAAVRDAERLVQVDVRHVGAEACPGRATPTSALRFAPSRYTCPPWSCTTAQMSPMCSSNTPCVDGYVTISAASCSACCAALASRSSRSTLPLSSHATTTTRMPAIAADAALVPCADAGIRHTSRCRPRRATRGSAGSRAGPRTRPASPRWAAATPRRSR